MIEKMFGTRVDDVDSSIINITRDGEDFAWFLSDIVTDKQVEKVVDKLNELAEEKDSLVAVIDENLLKGYHEFSIKHNEAEEKMKKGESSEVSPILDVIFYWTGYIKALEELKEEVE